MPWSNFNSDATWLVELYTPADWPHGHGGPFELPGVSVHTVYADYMHCKLLGTDQYIFGSVLWLLVYDQHAAAHLAPMRMEVMEGVNMFTHSVALTK